MPSKLQTASLEAPFPHGSFRLRFFLCTPSETDCECGYNPSEHFLTRDGLAQCFITVTDTKAELDDLSYPWKSVQYTSHLKDL